MTLLAPPRGSLQQMLNEFAKYCVEYCLKFNVAKTKVMVFGKISNLVGDLACIDLNGESIEFVSKCRYLGFYVMSSRHFKLSFREDQCGFFGAVNSVLYDTSKRECFNSTSFSKLYS